MKNKVKTPLFHISKRASMVWYKAWGVRAAAIVAALLVCSIITALVTGLNPIQFYGAVFEGSFGSGRKVWVLFQNVAMLLMIAVALTPAYKMRFWNIGAEGQILMGGLAAAALMINFGNTMPIFLLMPLMFMGSILAGAIWGAIPAFFKAKWNTNETLFTLMMNYIATQIVAYFIIFWEVPKGSGSIGVINPMSEGGWFPSLFGQKYLLAIVIAVIITVGVYVYLRYSKHGYEISVVGESEKTARYVGINVGKVIIRTMAISGALCGVVGLLLVASINHTLTTTITNGNGFTGVMIAWLGKFNPIGMFLTSFLVNFLQRGASEVSTNFGLNTSFSDILIGIILFFIIGCEFFINYKISFSKLGKKEG